MGRGVEGIFPGTALDLEERAGFFADLGKRRLESMKANEFDKAFDAGVDILKHLELSQARRPKQEQKRVNVDFPVWMIQLLDKEAKRLGVPRQSLIKVLIAQHLGKSSV